MSLTQAKEFILKISEDVGLKAELESLATVEEKIDLAKKMGYDISREEIASIKLAYTTHRRTQRGQERLDVTNWDTGCVVCPPGT